MRRTLRRCHRALAIALLLASLAPREAAAQAVFQGDPLNASTGAPWIVLPGLPLADWGDDEKWRTGDDVVNGAIVGDVDVVVRIGGAYVPGSGVIPLPAAGVDEAVEIVAGGLSLTPSGEEVPYQVILSNGASSPPAGVPLTTDDLDGRGTLVLVYPDLDGDGVIGPNAADGAADDRVEKQEALQVAGRRLSALLGGSASGTLAVALGAPASTGGLGLLVAAGAITGDEPPVYDDAGWIATRLPLVWPIDPGRIIGGGNPRPPDPDGLVDLEVEDERTFLPATTSPVFGNAFAIPLDGSSITNDVLRAVSGPAVAASFVRAVDPATFGASSLTILRATTSDLRGRVVVEDVDALSLPDDGPGEGATVLLQLVDRLGNPADPLPGGGAVTLEASAGLRIAAPDVDGDPAVESVPFASGEAVTVVLDDDGAARDTGPSGTVVALHDGAPAAALRVAIGRAERPAADPLASGSVAVSPAATRDRVVIRARMTGVGAVDFAAQDLTVALHGVSGAVFQRTIPAGTLAVRQDGAKLSHREPAPVADRIASLVLRRSVNGAGLRIDARGDGLATALAASGRVTAHVVSGAVRFRSVLTCVATSPGVVDCTS